MTAQAELSVVYQTRFSFFGQSGWQSAYSGDPEKLFDPLRLEARFLLFEAITLASLVGQEDPRFHHMVLSSTLMPESWQRRLVELVNDVLGADRAQVIFRPAGGAGRLLRSAVQARFRGAPVAQVVLDDDDAIATDFTSVLRHYGAPLLNDPHNPAPYSFLSFAHGLTLAIDPSGGAPQLEGRFVPYNNQALTVLGPGDAGVNPYLVSHHKVGQRHPSLLFTQRRPYHLRTVHGLNDSRAHRQDRQMEAGELAQALAFFPFLGPMLAPRADDTPAASVA